MYNLQRGEYYKVSVYILFIKRQIKSLKMFCPKTWWAKKSFGYRVAHHGYLLTSRPGQYNSISVAVVKLLK